MSIKVGLQAQAIPPVELSVGQAVEAEARGYDSVWYPDHLMGWFPRALWTADRSSIVNILPSPHMYLDPAVVLALAGEATSKTLLGTGVTEPIRRPPPELARTFLTLSHSTSGRAILGIGAGEKENIEPYGLDYRFQVSKLEEALKIIRLLWESTDYVDFDGLFWKLNHAVLDLPPYGGEYPPIWIGAHGPRMLEITGKYADGWIPSYPMQPSDYAERLARIRKAAEESGRDPAAITAGYQMYAVVAPDHETSHQILASPLAGAMALVAAASQWEAAGRKHPLGDGFEGLRDYVPEWYSKEELEAAVAQYEPDVFHDLVAHGDAQDVVKFIEPFIDAGLEHVVFTNIAALAGLEHLGPAQEGLAQVAATLKS
jgi:phthiodiolone/phenolphthiodiolone dimycocerosates ketoreductase